MMPGKDKAGQLFANLQMGLSIASTVAGIPGMKTAIGNKIGSWFGTGPGGGGGNILNQTSFTPTYQPTGSLYS